MKHVYIKDNYGDIIRFGIIDFTKRINHNNTHEVWKFKGIEMETVGVR